jgi:hypothetical protein
MLSIWTQGVRIWMILDAKMDTRIIHTDDPCCHSEHKQRPDMPAFVVLLLRIGGNTFAPRLVLDADRARVPPDAEARRRRLRTAVGSARL